MTSRSSPPSPSHSTMQSLLTEEDMMAVGPDPEPENIDMLLPEPPVTPLSDSYEKIAQAVVALILPIITSVVDNAVSSGIEQLCKELGEKPIDCQTMNGGLQH